MESAREPKGTLSTSLARANALRVAPTCAADAPNSSANMGKTGATHEWPAMSSAVVTQMPATRLFSPRNPARSHMEESEFARGPVGAPASATGDDDDDDDDVSSSMSLRASRPEVNAAEDDENALRASHPAPNPDSSPRDVVGRRCAQSRRTSSSSRHRTDREPSGSNESRASRATSEDPTAAGGGRRARLNPRRRVPTNARDAMGEARGSGRRGFSCPGPAITSTALNSGNFDVRQHPPRAFVRPSHDTNAPRPLETPSGRREREEWRRDASIAVRSEGSTRGVWVGSRATIARSETIPRVGGGA